jgi:hypothetical protein
VNKRHRPLREEETAILDRLLESPFPGRDELREQVPLATAAHIECTDDCGSLEFNVAAKAPRANVDKHPAVEAVGHDADGVPYEVLLHVRDGLLHELEFWKGDGSEFVRRPRATDLVVRKGDLPDVRDFRGRHSGDS